MRFAWPDSPPLFLDVDLRVESGAHVLVHGRSGSGKSTLLSLLAGIVVVESGYLSVLGSELKAISRSARDAFRGDHMGFIFQEHNLLPYLSVEDNILSSLIFSHRKRERESRSGKDSVRRYLNELSLDVSPNAYPRQLSVGQRQRVAIARALIGEPEIIFADEPSSALDEKTGAEFLDLLFEECNRHGATLMMVSHDRSFVDRFSRTVDIDVIREEPHD